MENRIAKLLPSLNITTNDAITEQSENNSLDPKEFKSQVE